MPAADNIDLALRLAVPRAFIFSGKNRQKHLFSAILLRLPLIPSRSYPPPPALHAAALILSFWRRQRLGGGGVACGLCENGWRECYLEKRLPLFEGTWHLA